jgi:hypothetical protein
MPTETELEHRLRSDLRSRQAEAPLLPADLVDVVRRRHRRGRRAQLLTAAAAVAVVALFTGAATLIGDRTPGRSSDTAGTPSARPVPGILDWPTRGSLAGDTDWVEGVRRLDWDVPSELQGDAPEPPVDARHVAFAGDVPDGRVALVVGVDDGLTAAAWFTGPADAEPADMEAVDLPQRAHPTTSAQAMVRSASPTGADVLLVAVGPPGSSMDLSAPPAVDAAGGESHPRVELPTDDGVAVYTLQGSWSFTREIRIRVDDRLSYQVLPTLVFTDDPGPTGPRRGEVEMTEDFIVGETTASLLAEYALTEDQARPSVLVSGDGHGDADGTERAVLIGLTFPSGATGVWLLTYEKQPDGWSSTLGRLPHAPAGTRVEERLVAVPVDGAHLALHAPAAAVRAEVLTAEGAVLGSVDLVDGGYVGEVPGGSFAPSTDGAATVRAVDAAGRTVSEGPIGRVVAE